MLRKFCPEWDADGVSRAILRRWWRSSPCTLLIRTSLHVSKPNACHHPFGHAYRRRTMTLAKELKPLSSGDHRRYLGSHSHGRCSRRPRAPAVSSVESVGDEGSNGSVESRDGVAFSRGVKSTGGKEAAPLPRPVFGLTACFMDAGCGGFPQPASLRVLVRLQSDWPLKYPLQHGKTAHVLGSAVLRWKDGHRFHVFMLFRPQFPSPPRLVIGRQISNKYCIYL